MFENLFKKGRTQDPQTARFDFLTRYEQNQAFGRDEILGASYEMQDALQPQGTFDVLNLVTIRR